MFYYINKTKGSNVTEVINLKLNVFITYQFKGNFVLELKGQI